MRELATDVAIIGGGTAGLNARREVGRAGKSWLLIEGGVYGTTCARVGCMPSKLLVAAGESALAVRHAGAFGVQVDAAAIRIDGPAVLARVRRERDRFAGLVARDVQALPPEQRVQGYARFVGPTELVVDDHTHVRAGAVVVASGSRPKLPDLLSPVLDKVLTSDTIFELPELPRSLAVLGTGAIGLELGQALAALGVRVTFFNPGADLGFFTDPVLKQCSRKYWGAELDVQLGVRALAFAPEGSGVRLRYITETGAQQQADFEAVLAATGRTPNVEKLGLEHTGLALDARGVPRFDPETMQCGTAPIFLAGDVSGARTLLHEAVDEGGTAGANAARFPDVQPMLRKTPLAIGFTQPRCALVGKPYAEAVSGNIAIGESSYEDQGRARVIDEPRGLVRVYVERGSSRLLGAELLGPGVEHTAHLLAWAVQSERPLLELLHMPVYHPTLEEGIRTALRDAAQKLGLLAGCAPPERGSGPGA